MWKTFRPPNSAQINADISLQYPNTGTIDAPVLAFAAKRNSTARRVTIRLVTWHASIQSPTELRRRRARIRVTLGS